MLFVSDILKIDNLWCFVNLVKLQLDNNIIEKIEGLDMLTNLVWLGKLFLKSVMAAISLHQLYSSSISFEILSLI